VTVPHRASALHVSLWIVQVLLASIFGLLGALKLASPESFEPLLPPLARFIGAAELAGALGLILPAATRIRPILSPLAAVGLVIVMLLAAGFNLQRGEYGSLPINLVLGVLAGFVAWGRLTKAKIPELV
jgi:putative oxidoreductase